MAHDVSRLLSGVLVALVLVGWSTVAQAECSETLDGSPCLTLPGACEGEVCVTPGEFTRVRFKGQAITSTGELKLGAIVLRGNFETFPPADVFDAASGISVRVTDGLGVDRRADWAPEECVTFPKGGIRCKVDIGERRLKGRFNPMKETPEIWRYVVRMKRLDIDPPFQAPVTADISHNSGVDRRKSITACLVDEGSGSLNCKPSYAP